MTNNIHAFPTAANGPADPAAGEIVGRLAFFRNLQAVTTRIHATGNVGEIMLTLSHDISGVFNADRLTLYVVSEDGAAIVSKVKTGLNAFEDIRLPIAEDSIAGYVALTRQVLNVRDAYDEAELRAISPELRLHREVDQRSGYRSRQMLVAPIVEAGSGELLGVVQLINNKAGVPFSAFAEEGLQILAQTLSVALAQRQRPQAAGRSRYEFLIADGILSSGEFDLATRAARRQRLDVEEILVREFHVKPCAIGAALSRFFGVPYEPYRSDRIEPAELMNGLKRERAEQEKWLPLEAGADGVTIVTPDPERVQGARLATGVFPGTRLDYRVTTSREFKQMVDQFFGPVAGAVSSAELLAELSEDEQVELTARDVSAAAESELVRLVNKIITDAHQQGASDIHVEPRPGRAMTPIRFRRDGVLTPYMELPASYRNALVTRIKLMAELDAAERRRPQEGRIGFRKFGPLDIELRVTTIPSLGGVEDVVMHLAGQGGGVALDQLGMRPDVLQRLRQSLSRPHGLVLACGPAGSGKSTTLHALLAAMNRPEAKVWTVEDPVEIVQTGLRQVQIGRKAGADAAALTRAVLQADPDVVMIQDLADRETVAAALDAALAGHLVLAGMRTPDPAESVARLLDMGADRYGLADAFLAAVGLRLARRLCPSCRQPHPAQDEEISALLDEYCAERMRFAGAEPDDVRARCLDRWRQTWADAAGRFTLHRAAGCQACAGLGYRGRIGLHQALFGDDQVRRAIRACAPAAELASLGLAQGGRSVKTDGIEKVLAGITDMQQVRSACAR